MLAAGVGIGGAEENANRKAGYIWKRKQQRESAAKHIKKFRSSLDSFIHSGHFYSAPSSPLPLRGAPDSARMSEFHAEAHRQLQVKDLAKVPTWRLERESNPRPSGWKSSPQPRRLHVPQRIGQIFSRKTKSSLENSDLDWKAGSSLEVSDLHFKGQILIRGVWSLLYRPDFARRVWPSLERYHLHYKGQIFIIQTRSSNKDRIFS